MNSPRAKNKKNGATLTRQLFIAEKPSLAEAIALALAEKNGVQARKGSTEWEVGEDKVTWVYGHMYGLWDAKEYDPQYASWNIAHLPIIPDPWKLKPTIHPDPNFAKRQKNQLEAIGRNLKVAQSVVNAGDAGREGQLLVDELLVEHGWDPFSGNTKRIWVSETTRKAILAGLNNLIPNGDKKSLYDAAVCRQRADWLHGINMTILFTAKAEEAGIKQLLSVGRVQTPTLRLVVDRDLEIKNFKRVDHYLPTGMFTHENGKFKAEWIIPEDYDGLDSEGRLVDKSVADNVLERVSGQQGTVTAFNSSIKKKAPPLPFSLSTLQKDCSAKFGLTAQQTLDVAKRLYEAKITSYPRSNSEYLSNAILVEDAPVILQNLKDYSGDIGDVAKGTDSSLKSPAWNDAKVTDHHGIIPTIEATAAKTSSLTGIDKRVYDLIAKTFLAQFFPDQRWKAISAQIKVGEDEFKASGRLEVDAGWKAAFATVKVDKDEDGDENNDESDQSLPQMSKGDPVAVESGSIQAKRTKPPAHFTDGTLIDAMKNAHKFVPDSETKRKLKENVGIGEESTRSNILESLLNPKRGYLIRKGKKILSTPTGQSLIKALPEDITSPGLTAIWESYLEKVSDGELSLEKFMEGQVANVRQRVDIGKNSTVKIDGAKAIEPLEGHGKPCPKCGTGQMITRQIAKGKHKGKKFLSCNQYPNCDAVEWPQLKIDPIEGHGTKCPKCGEGTLQTRQVQAGEHKGKKFLSCDQYRVSGCKYSAWPRPAVKPIEGHGKQCPKCQKGKMETRKSKKGTLFLGCNMYPECDSVEFQKDKDVTPLSGDGETCTKCNKGKMVTRPIRKGKNAGKTFLGCNNYPECDNTIWPK